MKNKLLILAFLEGFILVSLELFAAQLLQPFYGNTYFSWVSMLSVTMVASAGGYFLGSRIQIWDDIKKKNYLIAVLLILSAFYLVAFNYSQYMFEMLHKVSFLKALFIHTILLIFIPILGLTSTSPLIIQLYSKYASKSGKSSGDVFFVSTLGGIISVYSIAFLLLPNFDLKEVIYALAMLLFAINLIITLSISNIKIIAIQIVVLIALFFITDKKETKNKNSTMVSLHKENGIMGQVEVREFDNEKRFLVVNNSSQSGVDKNTGKSLWKYPLRVTTYASLSDRGSDVLIAGLGAGVLVSQLKYFDFNIDLVEFDKRIYDISKRYMKLNTNFYFEVDDFRHYINNVEKKYDVIIVDLSKGESIPNNVYSLESFQRMAKLLKPEGYILVHFFSDIYGNAGDVYSSLLKTLDYSGLYFSPIRKYEGDKSHDKIIAISNVPEIIKSRSFKIPISLLDKAEIAHENIFDNSFDYSNGKIIRDDNSILELLQFPVIEKIRNKLRMNEYKHLYNEDEQ